MYALTHGETSRLTFGQKKTNLILCKVLHSTTCSTIINAFIRGNILRSSDSGTTILQMCLVGVSTHS